MAYLEQWKRIAARISGLVAAGSLHARLTGGRPGDYGESRGLRAQCASVLQELEKFVGSFGPDIPAPAKQCIDAFVKERSGLINDESGTPDASHKRVAAALVYYSALETEMAFLLNDAQEAIRVRSERAFAHLQRLIVADPEVRAKWREAFDQGEISCEKLGAVHLLLHGIFAFKVHGAGERTDLVYQDRHGMLADEQRYSEGLTLTEWKVCRDLKDAESTFSSAREQAARYGKGVLGGAELVGFRYAVVVSDAELAVPADVELGGVRYRHINIVTNPATPSVGARRPQSAPPAPG